MPSKNRICNANINLEFLPDVSMPQTRYSPFQCSLHLFYGMNFQNKTSAKDTYPIDGVYSRNQIYLVDYIHRNSHPYAFALHRNHQHRMSDPVPLAHSIYWQFQIDRFSSDDSILHPFLPKKYQVFT